MFAKKSMWMAVAVATILSLIGAVTAFAGAPSGAGPDDALAPSSGWVQLNAGQQLWYAFNSSGAGASATDAQIIARLTADPQGSVAFSVWTDEAARAMLAGDTTAKEIGDGTLHPVTDGNGGTYDRFNGDLLWDGTSRDSASYFLVVQSLSNTTTRFMLTITGNYISFPAAAAATTAAPASSSAGTAPAVLPSTGQSQAPAPASNQANQPLMLDGSQHTIGAGQQQWYAFQYPGPDSDGNRPVDSAMLIANPANAVTFNVWDPSRLADYASGDPNVKATGAGTLHPVNDGSTSGEDRFNGNLDWSGAFGMAGTYYIQVMNNSNATATYTLQFTQP